MVWGASSGVGLALAHTLAADGDDVLSVSRRASHAPEETRTPAAQADLREYDEVEAVISQAQQDGGLDYIVNCVGVGFYAPIGQDGTTAWDQILATNVRGLLNLLTAVERHCPDLLHFVHVSSLAAHRVSRTPGNLAYSVSKAGARTVVQEFRRELRLQGRRTRVSMVSPGFVAGTDFDRNFYVHARPEEPVPDLYGDHANLSPQDVAGVVRYVLGTPAHLEVLDILVGPTEQPS